MKFLIQELTGGSVVAGVGRAFVSTASNTRRYTSVVRSRIVEAGGVARRVWNVKCVS